MLEQPEHTLNTPLDSVHKVCWGQMCVHSCFSGFRTNACWQLPFGPTMGCWVQDGAGCCHRCQSVCLVQQCQCKLTQVPCFCQQCPCSCFQGCAKQCLHFCLVHWAVVISCLLQHGISHNNQLPAVLKTETCRAGQATVGGVHLAEVQVRQSGCGHSQ